MRESALPHTFSIRLQAVYDTLKSAERKAADLLLQTPREVAGMSISEAAMLAGCSEPTLTRLARKLGFSGYSDMKNDLVESLADESQKRSPAPSTLSPKDMLPSVFASLQKSIRDTASIIDEEVFAQAVSALLAAKRILFLGAAEASSMATLAVQSFMLAGYPCETVSDSDLQLLACNRLTEDDVCVVFSHSGRSRSMVSAARRARMAGATVISITNYPISPLSKQSAHVLLTATFDEIVPGLVLGRRMLQMCLVECLLHAMLVEDENHQQMYNGSISTLQITKQ